MQGIIGSFSVNLFTSQPKLKGLLKMSKFFLTLIACILITFSVLANDKSEDEKVYAYNSQTIVMECVSSEIFYDSFLSDGYELRAFLPSIEGDRSFGVLSKGDHNIFVLNNVGDTCILDYIAGIKILQYEKEKVLSPKVIL